MFRPVCLLAIIFNVLNWTFGTYVITTPSSWIEDASSQTCVTLTNGLTFTEDDFWSINAFGKTRFGDENQGVEVIPKIRYQPSPGTQTSCLNITVPSNGYWNLKLHIEGSIGGKTFSEEGSINSIRGSSRTFIQTDKQLYKPGQTVNFRILSVYGPFLKISTENYTSVHIESPKQTRIAQWLNVDNRPGLVHLSFTLHNEEDEGRYKIVVKKQDQSITENDFDIGDYVLPRYEVTINPPPYILGSDKTLTINLCANYTYGKPVKGTAKLSVHIGRGSLTYANITLEKEIDGCTSFTYNTKDLRFDDNNCHIRIWSVHATALVTEQGTGNEIFGKEHNIRVHRRAIQFEDTSTDVSFKSHLPRVWSLRATFPDGSPAPAEPIESCIFFEEQRICKIFFTSQEGDLEVLIPPSHRGNVDFKAVKYPRIVKDFNNVMEESTFTRYYFNRQQRSMAHNSSLTVFTDDEVVCNSGKPATFTLSLIYVVEDETSADIHIQGISRGQVQFFHKQFVQFVTTELPFDSSKYILPLPNVPPNVRRGMITIPVELPNTISPAMKIVAWFKTHDNVVIADSGNIDISPCLSSAVSMSWSTQKAEPGKSVDLQIDADPGSLCSVDVVDKSVELLANRNRFTAESLLQSMYFGGNRQFRQSKFEDCMKKYGHTDLAKKLVAINTQNSTEPSFKGYYIPYYHDLEALHAFNDAGYLVFSDLDMEKKMCLEAFENALSIEEVRPTPSFGTTQISPEIAEPDIISIMPIQEDSDSTTRDDFPETWLWELLIIPSSGQLVQSHELLDTITEWVGNTVCVNHERGVSISNSSSVITFTSFFTDVTLPSSVKRGEILPVIISIFNYEKEPQPVTVKLEDSLDFDFASGLDTTESGQRNICVPANDKVVVTIKIRAKIIGEMNLTIDASTNLFDLFCNPYPKVKRDRMIRSIPVEAEGFLRERIWNQYLCSQDYLQGTTSDPWEISMPTNIVEGSDRSWVTAIGDLLGPTVESLGHLVRLPFGCGEQNMLNFSPNTFILQYLESSEQNDPLMTEKLKSYMNSGYNNQLRFRRKDGSFSTFGERDNEGSTWLTAFVMKSFVHASRYISIDPEIQRESLKFLRNQSSNGCFEIYGNVINKRLAGGVGRTKENSTMTAYIVAALIEARANAGRDQIIKNALECVRKSNSDHPYDLALQAYAMALAQSNDVKLFVDKLIASADSHLNEMSWTIPGHYKNSALAVETAAYALMAMLICDKSVYAQPARNVVRWLTGRMNGYGGFISTQDTVVALQALAYFERIQPGGTLDLSVTLQGDSFTKKFLVADSNKFVLQRLNLPSSSGNININTEGAGCALVQAVQRYNVLKPESSDAFIIKGRVTPDNNCEFYSIESCVSYTLPDGASNMAILEISLLSGYRTVNEDLRKIASMPPFKKYEIANGKVLLYLEAVDATDTCVSFNVFQEFTIDNIKPGTMKIYDYYQPEYASEMTYVINVPRSCS